MNALSKIAYVALLASGCAHTIQVDTPAPTPAAPLTAQGPAVAIEYVGVRWGGTSADVSDELLLLVANQLRKAGLFAAVYEAAVAHEAPPDALRLSLNVEQREQLEGTASGMLKALVVIYSLGLLDFLVPYHYGYEVRLEASFAGASGSQRTYGSQAEGSATYSSLFADVRRAGIDTRSAVLERAFELLIRDVASGPRLGD